MKFSYNWLAELVGGIEIDPKELGLLITLKTAEQEGTEPAGGDDHAIEIDNKSLTHRPDLWGHLGMAREVAAILGKKLVDPVDLSLVPKDEPPIQVSIEDYALAPRYSGLVFENVTVMDSPPWIQKRLAAVDLNPINNIVDVTNLVMAEMAQPMHAFDQETLHGHTIFVRRAKAGEHIVALNEESYTLDEQALVIADQEGPVAIAGVIGGLATGVTAKTTRIVLESANFHPGSIRKTSARLKLRTDASIRFEKAQDPHNTVRGLARAVALLEEVSPGIRIIGGVADACRPLPSPAPIELPLDWLRRKLGREVAPAEVRSILEALGFGVTEPAPGVLRVTVPSWRATKDISLKDDLVEEVGRMIGYGSIPPQAPLVPASPPPSNPERDYFNQLRSLATARGFTESYNYSFVNEQQLIELDMDPAQHIHVLNPISSDQGLLRSSLLPGLLRNLRDNSRHYDAFRLFEIGYEIHPRLNELPNEVPHLAATVFDRSGDGEAGLMEGKLLAESLLPGIETRPATARSFEHPVRAWEILRQGAVIGRLGELHPRLLAGRAAVVDLNLGLIQSQQATANRYRPLPRFPSSSFDLTVVTGLRELVSTVSTILATPVAGCTTAVEFLRQYAGSPLPAGKKSLSFHITVNSPEHTLSQEEIAGARQGLIDLLRGAGYDLTL